MQLIKVGLERVGAQPLADAFAKFDRIGLESHRQRLGKALATTLWARQPGHGNPGTGPRRRPRVRPQLGYTPCEAF